MSKNRFLTTLVLLFVLVSCTGELKWSANTPSLVSIGSDTNDGSYTVGHQINIQLVFNHPVAVSGTPSLPLETGSTDRAALYSSGSGGNTLTFVYTVSAGDTTSDLELANEALDEIKAYITGVTGLEATFDFPTGSNSLSGAKDIAIDTTAPSNAGSFTATPANAQVSLGWTSSGGGDSYLIVRRAGAAVTHTPTTGDSTYTLGEDLGSGEIVVYAASIVGATDTSVTNGVNYYYKIYSYDAAGNFSSGASTGPVMPAPTWRQQAYVKAPNLDATDMFGYSVSASSDTVVVTAPLEDSNQTTITNGSTTSADNSAASSGAAYVYTRSGSTWSQQAYLKASNAENGDRFGESISIDGDTIVVGASDEDGADSTIINGTTGSTDNNASYSGAAYVYFRSGSTWTQQAYLKPANPGASDRFGYAVAISSDTILVGAPFEDSNYSGVLNGSTAAGTDSWSDAGAAYVFHRTGSTWTQQAYLKPPYNGNSYRFGYRLGIDGETAVATAFGEASSQTSIINGTAAASDSSSSDQGAAYVFKRTGSTWAQEAYLKAANGQSYQYYGRGVTIDGDTVAVGGFDDTNSTAIINGTNSGSGSGLTDSGAAYIYYRSGSTWAPQAFIKTPNAGASDYLGDPLSLHGDTLVAGAAGEDSSHTAVTNGTSISSDNNSSSGSGAAYVFKRTGSTWTHEAYLKAPNNGSEDEFGYSVAINGDTVVVGARDEDSSQSAITNGSTATTDDSLSDSGAAYIFLRY